MITRGRGVIGFNLLPIEPISSKKVSLQIFFFDNNKEIHVASENQKGCSAFIWTTKDGCLLALRARLSAFLFCVREIWMICELWKLAFKIVRSAK